MQDVAALAVLVLQERNARRSVWVILNLVHGCTHIVLIATEIDAAITSFVATTAVAAGDNTTIVTPCTAG